MKRKELIIITIIAIVLGTSMHFAHHLSFFNHFMGYIFPFTESVWEHMKMLFYPMMLVSIWQCCREKKMAPFGGMIFSNLVCIPLQIFLFYVYAIFVGHSLLVVDCIAYVVVMIFGIWFGNRLSQKPGVRKAWPWAVAVAVVMIILLGVLSYHHPAWGLFIPEA